MASPGPSGRSLRDRGQGWLASAHLEDTGLGEGEGTPLAWQLEPAQCCQPLCQLTLAATRMYALSTAKLIISDRLLSTYQSSVNGRISFLLKIGCKGEKKNTYELRSFWAYVS